MFPQGASRPAVPILLAETILEIRFLVTRNDNYCVVFVMLTQEASNHTSTATFCHKRCAKCGSSLCRNDKRCAIQIKKALVIQKMIET
jgi:hypothetical protein